MTTIAMKITHYEDYLFLLRILMALMSHNVISGAVCDNHDWNIFKYK